MGLLDEFRAFEALVFRNAANPEKVRFTVAIKLKENQILSLVTRNADLPIEGGNPEERRDEALTQFFNDAVKLHNAIESRPIHSHTASSFRNRVKNWGRQGKGVGSLALSLETYFLLHRHSWADRIVEQVDHAVFDRRSYEEATGHKKPTIEPLAQRSPEASGWHLDRSESERSREPSTEKTIATHSSSLGGVRHGRIHPAADEFSRLAELIRALTGKNARNFLMVGEQHFFERYGSLPSFFSVPLMGKDDRDDRLWSIVNTLALSAQDRKALLPGEIDQLFQTLVGCVHLFDDADALTYSETLQSIYTDIMDNRDRDPLFRAIFQQRRRLSSNYPSFWHIRQGHQHIGQDQTKNWNQYLELHSAGYDQIAAVEQSHGSEKFYWTQRSNALTKLGYMLIHDPSYFRGDKDVIYRIDAIADELSSISNAYPHTYLQQSYLDLALAARSGEEIEEKVSDIAVKLQRHSSGAPARLMAMSLAAETGSVWESDAGQWFERRDGQQQRDLIKFGLMSISPALRAQLKNYFLMQRKMLPFAVWRLLGTDVPMHKVED